MTCHPCFLRARYTQTSGVIGLGAGIDFINKIGIDHIYAHERKLCELFIREVRKIKRVQLYGTGNLSEGNKVDTVASVPLVPFNIEGMESSRVATLLSEAGVCLRGGLHCSYLAHKKMNTLYTGVVRMAPSVFNTKKEVVMLLRQLDKITKAMQ